jgi:hypothetical protein
MKLDLNKPIFNLLSEPIPNTHLGKFLGDEIAASNSQPVVKFFDWAVKLYRTGLIEIDNSDRELIKKFIEDSPRMTVLVKGQLLKEINDLKDV